MSSPPSPQPTPPAPRTSSSIIGSNDDILTQLLICLPIKSLRRFRRVSKQWCSLISGNYFIQKRLSRKYRHRSINGLFLHRGLDPCSWDNTWKFDFISLDPNISGKVISTTTLTFVNDLGGIQIEQSCNGLLLCSTFKIGKSVRIYYIYNPTTEKYTTLPRFDDGKYSYGPYFSVSLAFNPIKSPHYKVICMLKDNYDYEIRIYSSETCSWKVITRLHDYYFLNICGSGVFWNGFLFWHNVGKSMVYFDIERDIFGKEPMPRSVLSKSISETSLYFGECKGHLYYIELSQRWEYFDGTIIIHERYYRTGWRTAYSIDISRLGQLPRLKKIGYSNISKSDVKVLLVDGEEIEEEEYEPPKLVLQIRDKVFSLDLGDSDNIKKIHDTEQHQVVHAYRYIKSFAAV